MKDEPPKIRTILCPVNFTRIARELLTHACSLAEVFGAELIVMYVAETIDEEHVPHVETAFSNWIDPQVQKNCSYKQLLVRAEDAAEKVLQTAQEMAVDLIVVGAQHRFFHEATVIGTTSRAHHAVRAMPGADCHPQGCHRRTHRGEAARSE